MTAEMVRFARRSAHVDNAGSHPFARVQGVQTSVEVDWNGRAGELVIAAQLAHPSGALLPRPFIASRDCLLALSFERLTCKGVCRMCGGLHIWRRKNPRSL